MKKQEELIDKAKEAMKKRDYDQAKKILEDLDKQGNLYATVILAKMFLQGYGVTANPQKAEQLFLNASAEGYIEADYSLGIMYATGSIGEPNLREAIKYLTAAANKGHILAQFHLGKAYKEGLNNDKEAAKARGYFLPAAQKDHKEGLLNFAQDLPKAREYFLSAAQKDHKEAQYYLGLMCIKGEGGEKNEAEGLEWFAKAAREGCQEAIYWLNNHANKCRIGAEDTSKQVPKLIGAAKQLLGEDYSKDLEGMFSGLWHEGVPVLSSKLFYNYEYKFYSSRQSLPANKQEEIVYLYVENSVLHYQVLKKKVLCQGTLDVSGFNLSLLEEVSFTKVPPLSGDVRKIYYRCSSAQTNCIYEVVGDDGRIYVGAMDLTPNDKKEAIEEKLLEVVKDNHCKQYLKSLQNELQKQLIQNGHIEFSYENKCEVLKKYQEMLSVEGNFLKFLKKFVGILKRPEFKEFFSHSEEFEKMVKQYLLDVKGLRDKQKVINSSLQKQAASSPTEVIDALQFAYDGGVEIHNYYNMMNFVQYLGGFLNELIEANPSIKDKIEDFCQKWPDILPSSQLLNLQTIFSQFITRKRLLLQDFARNFSMGHNKLHELNSIFFLFNKLATVVDRALPQSCEVDKDARNLEKLHLIQSRLAKEKIKLKTMCFDLLKPIFKMLMLEVEQVDKGSILTQYYAQKRELVECLEKLAKCVQSEVPENTSIGKQIGQIMELIQDGQDGNDLPSIIERIARLMNSIHALLPEMNLNVTNNLDDSFERDQERLFSPPKTKERRASRVSNSILGLSGQIASPFSKLKGAPRHELDSDLSLYSTENGEDPSRGIPTKKQRPRQKSCQGDKVRSSVQDRVKSPVQDRVKSPVQDLVRNNFSPKKVRAVFSELGNGHLPPLVDDPTPSSPKVTGPFMLSASCSMPLPKNDKGQKTTIKPSGPNSPHSQEQSFLGNRNASFPSRPNAFSVGERNEDRSLEGTTRTNNVGFFDLPTHSLPFLKGTEYSMLSASCSMPLPQDDKWRKGTVESTESSDSIKRSNRSHSQEQSLLGNRNSSFSSRLNPPQPSSARENKPSKLGL